MKLRLNSVNVVGILVTLALGCASSNAWAQTLYAVSSDAQLLSVNTATGQAKVIGSLDITFPSEYVGMDFDIDGTLYIGESREGNLYRVDSHTGKATFVRSISTDHGLILENMAFAPVPVPGPGGKIFPAGTLFGSENGNLHAINIQTGEIEFLGDTGHDDDAYAMTQTGVLYGLDASIAYYRVGIQSGDSSVLQSPFPGYVSLAITPDLTLYTVDQDMGLWKGDATTGAASFVGNTGYSIFGLAFSPNANASVPEPGSLALLGAGALSVLLGLYRKRKKATFRSTYSLLLAAICLCIPALTTAQTVEYISPGSTFKYVNTQQSTSADALGIDTTDFTQPGYDDSAWLTGAAPFGNVSSGDFGYNTYWQANFDPILRKSITLASPVTMTVNLGVDNGFDFYVNGKLITGSYAEGYTNRWEYTFSVDASHFVAGNNVIALTLQDNGVLTAFDMQMLGPAPSSVPEPGAWIVLAIGIVDTLWLLRRQKSRR